MSIENAKILILDDENAIKENLVLFLEDENFLVSSVDSAEKGLELLNNGKKFNVGIIDIRLPQMSGDEFILQAHKISPDMKFIIHTGSMNFELNDSELETIGLTCKDVFKKPVVDINALITRIKEII